MLEASGRDWLNVAARATVAQPLSESGHLKVEFSSECDAVIIGGGPGSPDAPRGAAALEHAGLVVTDRGAVVLTPRGTRARYTLPTPASIGGAGEVAQRPVMLHCGPAPPDDSWEAVLVFGSDRRCEQARRALDALRPADAPAAGPLQLPAWVDSRAPDLSDADRTRLGLTARSSADERTERWREEQRRAHQRRQMELDALRSRGRRRSPSPADRDSALEVFRREQETERREREARAAARLEEQRVRAAQERLQRERQELAQAQQLRMEEERGEAAAADAREEQRRREQQQQAAARQAAEEERAAARQRREQQEQQEREEQRRRDAERNAELERQRTERMAAERANQQELIEEKARRALEEERAKVAASRRYALSQRFRQERSAVAREEEQRRLLGRGKEQQSWAALVDSWAHVQRAAAAALKLHGAEEEEHCARRQVELEERDGRGGLQWAASRDHNHACEVERRGLMDAERAARAAVGERQLGAVADLALRMQGAEILYRGAGAPPALSDTSSDAPSDALAPHAGSPDAGAEVFAVLPPDGDPGSPSRATQTPGYAFAAAGVGADGAAAIAAQLGELRRELRHERELRLRGEERLADQSRDMAARAAELSERERELLRQLDREHAERLEQVRGFLAPRVESLSRTEDADRLLSRVAEREEEWARREQELRAAQIDLEQDAARLRAELSRVSEQLWVAEQGRAELRARSEAAEQELQEARKTADKADQRLREVLLEEQELLARQEAAWRARLNDAESRLADAEGTFARRIEDRERFWSQQEQLLRERRERAEAERLVQQERAEGLQRRMEAAESDARRLREEVQAEATVAVHRVSQDARAARDVLAQERHRRQELEEALVAALEEQRRLGQRLDEARGRHSLLLRDAALAAARHEGEIARVTATAPRGATRAAVLDSLETASRHQLIAVWQERAMELLRWHHHIALDFAAAYAGAVPPAPRWCNAINREGLAEQNAALRELLELEEGKVDELERALAEVRRQRDGVSRVAAADPSQLQGLRLQLAEAEGRAAIEQRCRDAVLDAITAPRGASAGQPAAPGPQCEGWLLASLADWHGGRPWRRLYCWLDPARALLLHAPADPRVDPQAPVSAVRLSRVLCVEVETFASPDLPPPPVNRYQQIGFYLETPGGHKHRFCAASVSERSLWLDHLRRAVLQVSAVLRRQQHEPLPAAAAGSPHWQSPRWGLEHSPPGSPTYRRFRRAEDAALLHALRPHERRRPPQLRRQLDGGLDQSEHLSYLGLTDGLGLAG